MAKLRYIKVEFWTSPQIVECEPISRLFFIALWNFCDDGGIHPYSLKRLKMEIFPADEKIFCSDIDQMLIELEKNNLVKFYTVKDEKYIKITGWYHQKIYEKFFKYPDEDGIVPKNKTYDRQKPKRTKRKPRYSKEKETNIEVTDGQQSVNTKATEGQHDCNEHINVNINVNDNVKDNGEENARVPALASPDIFHFKTIKFSTKIKQEYLDELVKNFEGVDVFYELGKMNQWYSDNPMAQITYKSFRSKIRKWMSTARGEVAAVG